MILDQHLQPSLIIGDAALAGAERHALQDTAVLVALPKP
jgi:hypothetical protein